MQEGENQEDKDKPKLREPSVADEAKQTIKETLQEMPPPQAEEYSDFECAPIVRMCNAIIVTAIESRADEVRIEPALRNFRVRIRIDGQWRQIMTIPKHIQFAMLNRYKVMADIPYWKKGVNTGRIPIKHGVHDYELLVTSIPGLYGDLLTYRIVPKKPDLPVFSNLGFSTDLWANFFYTLQPGGVQFIAGPRHSLKSTIAFRVLTLSNEVTRNLATIEEAVGHQLGGVTQTYRNPTIQVSARQLAMAHQRSGVDTLFLDNVNDADSAEAAFWAAENGLAVLATVDIHEVILLLHTLQRWGIDDKRLQMLYRGTLMVRPVRRLCLECREAYAPANDELSWQGFAGLEIDTLYRPKGCDTCGNAGFLGQTGIYSFTPPGYNDDRKEFLYADAFNKVIDGTTSLAEVLQAV